MDKCQASNEKISNGVYICFGIFLVVFIIRLLLKGSRTLIMASQTMMIFGAGSLLMAILYNLCIPLLGLATVYLFFKKSEKALTLFMIILTVDFGISLITAFNWFIKISYFSKETLHRNSNIQVSHISLFPLYGFIILEIFVLIYLVWEKFYRKNL